MNQIEKQALYHLREDLENHAFVTASVLRYFAAEGKITKAEKYDLSRMGSNAEKMRRLLQLLKNRKETLNAFINGLIVETKNNWVIQKIQKKINILRKRQQKQENKAQKSYFCQLDDIADILYTRGHHIVFGKSVKVAHNTIHETLVQDFNGLVGKLEECRETIGGEQDKSFQDVLKEYKEHRDREVEDARFLCKKMVITKNNDLEKKNKEIQNLKEELAKAKLENEKLRKTMDEEIKVKTLEGVRSRLLSFPNHSSGLASSTDRRFNIKPLRLTAEEPNRNIKATENVDVSDDDDDHSDDDAEEDGVVDTKITASEDAKPTRVTNNVNIYNNYMYSQSKLYQN